jgi:hypothetical protein
MWGWLPKMNRSNQSAAARHYHTPHWHIDHLVSKHSRFITISIYHNMASTLQVSMILISTSSCQPDHVAGFWALPLSGLRREAGSIALEYLDCESSAILSPSIQQEQKSICFVSLNCQHASSTLCSDSDISPYTLPGARSPRWRVG